MDKKTVYLIWGGGAVLALLIYLAGPDRVLTQLAYTWDSFFWNLHHWLRGLSGAAYNLLRACAIALFVVFWVLGVMVVRRGQPGKAALFWISLIFLVLVGTPTHWGYPVPAGDWLAGLLAAGVGALVMTKRLQRGGK